MKIEFTIKKYSDSYSVRTSVVSEVTISNRATDEQLFKYVNGLAQLNARAFVDELIAQREEAQQSATIDNAAPGDHIPME